MAEIILNDGLQAVERDDTALERPLVHGVVGDDDRFGGTQINIIIGAFCPAAVVMGSPSEGVARDRDVAGVFQVEVTAVVA